MVALPSPLIERCVHSLVVVQKSAQVYDAQLFVIFLKHILLRCILIR